MSSTTVSILTAIGGLGMFLMGMLVMTDGLRNLAGGRLQAFLARHTRSPASGAAAGALMTAILQSSSATTVAAVGFVGAGLLTFNQSLGIIFGANAGTTLKGWLVALVGFKLQLGIMLLPLLLAGVLLRLFARGWLSHAGFALAGFGLLFAGIDFLQKGMASLEGILTPDVLPSDTFGGRLLLLMIGMTITTVTQSSSAGVAAALAALGTGSISLIQAAVMVIGMDIATTFTALFASLGGSTASRRTGLAHVIYNVLTGIMAFAALYPLQWAVEAWTASGGQLDPQIALVAFHTLFNVVGVVAIIGFTPLFARLIIRLVPDKDASLTSSLDERLLEDANAATYAASASASAVTLATLDLIGNILEARPRRQTSGETSSIRDAARETQAYSDRIRLEASDASASQRRKATLHLLDHVFRSLHRCTQDERIDMLLNDKELKPQAQELRRLALALREEPRHPDMTQKLDDFRKHMHDLRHAMRERTIELTSQRKLPSSTALIRLDAIRWLHRMSYHVWRMSVHLPELAGEQAEAGNSASSPPVNQPSP